MTMRRMVLGTALATLLLAATACGGEESSVGDTGGATTDAPTDAGGGATETITIKDFAFDPATLTVSGPTDIEVVNEDDAEHSFTLDDDSVSQDVEAGDSATVTIDPAESIGWHCEYHPEMTGSITVA